MYCVVPVIAGVAVLNCQNCQNFHQVVFSWGWWVLVVVVREGGVSENLKNMVSGEQRSETFALSFIVPASGKAALTFPCKSTKPAVPDHYNAE